MLDSGVSTSCSRYATRLLLVVMGGVCLALYQNCGADFVPRQSDLESLKGFTCGTSSEEAFSQSFYPFLYTNCAQCHGKGLGPQFAVQSIAESYSAFAFMSQASFSKLRVNTVSGMHQGQGGPHLTSAFDKAESDFNSCKSGSDTDLASRFSVRTEPIEMNATATVQLRSLNPLETKLELGKSDLGGAILHFRVMTTVSGADAIYYIAQPSLQTTTKAIVVKSMRIKINGQSLDEGAQAFIQIDKVIPANTNPVNGINLTGNLSAGTAVFLLTGGAQPTDTIQFEFETLKAE